MARVRTPVPSLYVVQRIAMQSYAWGEEAIFWPNEADRQRGGVPIRGFAAKKPADKLCRELEQQARQTVSIGPFLYSLLPAHIDDVVEAAKVARVPVPDLSKAGQVIKPQRTDRGTSYPNEYWDYRKRVQETVAAWWATVAADVTPEANVHLWNWLFPDHRFYAVVRVLVEE